MPYPGVVRPRGHVSHHGGPGGGDPEGGDPVPVPVGQVGGPGEGAQVALEGGVQLGAVLLEIAVAVVVETDVVNDLSGILTREFF